MRPSTPGDLGGKELGKSLLAWPLAWCYTQAAAPVAIGRARGSPLRPSGRDVPLLTWPSRSLLLRFGLSWKRTLLSKPGAGAGWSLRRRNIREWEIWRVTAGRDLNVLGESKKMRMAGRKCIIIKEHETAILLSCANGIQRNLICNEEIHFHFIGQTKSCYAQETSFCRVPNSNNFVQTRRQGKKISHIKIPYVPSIFRVFPQTFEELNNKLQFFFEKQIKFM